MANTFGASGSEAAARYAQAAFELALEANALEALDKDLTAIAAAFAESAELRNVAASPLYETGDKAKALAAIAAKLGVSDLGRRVAGVAALNGRAAELPGLALEFKKLMALHKGVKEAEIVSARPLSAAQLDAIKNGLASALKTKIEAHASVDESLIGGFVVRVGSRQFDASLKSKLDAMRVALKTA